VSGAFDRWWMTLSMDERRRWHGVALCTVLFLIHYVLLSNWYIEDAAISFTYARHVATGEGWVTYPGGELVEGFSNPTWTVLLAVADRLFLGPWVAAKLFGALFGALTLPLAYQWARRLTGPQGLLPVAAPLLLAVSPQFVIWACSGLENSLFVLLLTAGSVWLMDEIQHGGLPWSAAAFGFAGITRPEGPMYIIVAACLGFAFAFRARGFTSLRWSLGWSLGVAVPLVLWQAYRMWTFAYPLPNTYYAKLQEMEKFAPLNWTKKGLGWRYIRRWALESTYGFLLPLAPLALSGLRQPRIWAGLLVAIVLGESLVPGLSWPSILPFWPAEEAEWKVLFRVCVLGATAVGLPLLGLGRRGDVARTLAWYMAAAAIFFAIYAGGDWMKGFRWLNMAAVPLSILTIDAIREAREVLAPLMPRRALAIRRTAFVLLFSPPFFASLVNTTLNLQGVETSPFDVRQRVLYMQSVQDRLHLGPLTAMDVDFGAHMWWSGDDLIDMAGLTDVPMGHHAWSKPFVREYVFHERKPEFAHAHAGWATKTGVRAHKEWRSDYVEIDGYATGRRFLHEGNFIRRDLFIVPTWTGSTTRSAAFQGALRLTGLETPSPTVAPGHGLYVELGWRSQQRVRDFRAVVFLSGPDRMVVQELPAGYDWYAPRRWRRQEIIVGRHTLTIPQDWPPGTYDLGLVVYEESGPVIPAVEAADNPRLARGELRWAGAVTVAPLAEVSALAQRLREDAILLATEADCDAAEASLLTATRHLVSAGHEDAPEVRAALATCWATRASTETRVPVATDHISRARRWNHRHPSVVSAGRQLADRWQAEGDAALDAPKNIEKAYQAYRRALIADPKRPWLRRKTEELRDLRHEGLSP
jgi:hypothetical protein